MMFRFPIKLVPTLGRTNYGNEDTFINYDLQYRLGLEYFLIGG